MFIDTHCHIHEENYPLDVGDVIARAHMAGVGQMVCVGTSEKSSKEALAFAARHEGVFASVGVHPHDTKDGWEGIVQMVSSRSLPLPPSQKHATLRHDNLPVEPLYSAELTGVQTSSNSQDSTGKFSGQASSVSLEEGSSALPLSSRSPSRFKETKGEEQPNVSPVEPEGMMARNGLLETGGRKGDRDSNNNIKLIAIGEIGLDYFYTHSPRSVQIKALEGQINLALRHNLPIIFHVRDAFDDFWPIFDNFHGIRGVLHSFTDSSKNVEEALKRGLFIGVNGISTFAKSPLQQQLFASLPLEKLLLETDAPFLTPIPLRGKVNEPAFVRHVAEFHATVRNVPLEEIAKQTTANARALFALS